jgi:predicted nuclease with RNAse H fold
MSVAEKIWIGADPGGGTNFGIALLCQNGSAEAFCVDCADDAVELVCKKAKSAPAGVGIDSPLWWSSGRSADRTADQWLRKKYGLSGGQVQTANSLRGAALVQGAMFAYRIRQCFPTVGVTETHPKAVLKALKASTWTVFAERFAVAARLTANRQHERDAIVSAVAAREGFEGRWRRDLSATRGGAELDPSTFWLAPIHYFWPE